MKKRIYIVSVIIVIVGLTMLNFHIDASTFDKSIWNKYPNKRHEMISDFEKEFSLEDLNRQNVIKILGKKNMSETENMFVYTVGTDWFETKYYAIVFNQQGECINRYVYQD